MECTSAWNAQPGTKTISGSPGVKPPISSVGETSHSQSKDNVAKTEEIVPSQKKYCKISNEKRLELIASVENNGQTVKAAADRLSINYSSAKSIYNIYKKEGRSNKKGFRNLAAGKKDPKTHNLEPNLSTTQPTVQSDSNDYVLKNQELKEQPVKTLLGKREHPDCPSDEKMTNPQFSNSSNNNNNQASCPPFSEQIIPNCSNLPQPPQVHQGQQFNFGMPVMMVQSNGFYDQKNNQNKQEFRCDNGNNMMICNPQQNNTWRQVQPMPQSFIIISSEPQPQHFVLQPIEQWRTNQPNQFTNVHQQNQPMNMGNCSSMQTVTTFYPNQTLQINHSSQKVEQFQYPNMMVAQSNNTQVQSGNYMQSVVTMVPINPNGQGQPNNFVQGFSMPNKEFAKNNGNYTTVNVNTSQDYTTSEQAHRRQAHPEKK